MIQTNSAASQDPEEFAVLSALENLERMSALQVKASTDYGEKIMMLRSDRRDMYKYLGTIAGGAAALAPNIYSHVLNSSYFFLGVSLELVCVAIAMTYLLGTVEKDADDLSTAYSKTTDEIQGMRQKYIDFIENKDYKPEKYIALNDEILKLAKASDTQSRPVIKLKWGFYKPMDYFTEYLLFTFISGALLLVLSIVNYHLSILTLIVLLVFIFVVISLIAIFPIRLFVLLGFPVGVLKGLIEKWSSGRSQSPL